MKHNDAVIRQYCRAVGKRLPLPAAQRRQLLTGLREELTESAQDCTTLDELIARVGTPDEAAQELLSGIAPERVHAYQKKRRWQYIKHGCYVKVLVIPEHFCTGDKARKRHVASFDIEKFVGIRGIFPEWFVDVSV